MKQKTNFTIFLVLAFLLALPASFSSAQLKDLRSVDSDSDGLNDLAEMEIYKTDPDDADTDRDGYSDGEEVKYLYDPNSAGDDKLGKRIVVDVPTQTLSYYLGDYLVGSFKVSTGRRGFETPKGEFSINLKKPVVRYSGPGYNYPNTRWNMRFTQVKAGGIYIHSAYWHDNFGSAFSHGCVNVAYKDMETLYNWTDVGTKVIVK